uniref:Uncharacterized protein n=1 Tax=Candidatus Methanophagaceae archaeon ANME-1 ERB6 TaxID=2759912 RepID=A0A7G9Z1B8_9EURY|nr:pentatricopeptide (PPR) repeat-containing [uncultured archaeon GZfos10C7]QNO54052.1 hypothetical protein JNMMCFNH_00004 [Methanosarcinales archaeon ANME-1 ERB6]
MIYMERHNHREYSEEEKAGKNVVCLSMDLIGSTKFMLGLTTPQQDRFNRSLVKQIRPHIEKLGLTDSLVKFTGDGWLVLTDNKPNKIQVLCCLATIMANKFQEEMSEYTEISMDRIPPLRLAICTGRDVCVELPPGNQDWVGDSARRATRATGWCKENEIVINDSIREVAFRDFLITPVTEKDHIKPDKWEEDFRVHTLGKLKPEAAADSEAPGYFVTTLETIGKKEEANEYSLMVSEHLEAKASKLGIDEIERKKILRYWNQLMSSISDSSTARKILKSIQDAGLTPDIFTYNMLIKKTRDYDGAKAWVDTMREEGIWPNVVTYNTLIDKAPSYNEAKALVDTMREEAIKPDDFTYNTLIKKAPDYDEAIALVDTMREETIKPDIVTYTTLIKKAPDYDKVNALVAMMQEEGIRPNVFTYSELIDKAPDYNEAKSWVYKMREEVISPNVFTYTRLIKKAPDYDGAKACVETMREESIWPNVFTYSELIDKAPDYNEAKSWVYKMREEGIKPNIVTYTTLIKKAPDYAKVNALVAMMREEGILPNVVTYNTLIEKAPDYDEANVWMETMKEENVQPDIFTYNTLIKKAPDYDEAKALVGTMRRESIQPNVFTYNTLFSKDISMVLADDVLKWYLAQKYHPPQPIQAAIASYRKRHCLDQALRLALSYPHLQAARKLIREHATEALAYFRRISNLDPEHPNADYALGITFVELGRELEAIPHLQKALELATADRRKKDIEDRLLRIDRKLSNK